MTWSVNDIYNLILFLTKKNQSTSISSKELFYAWNSEQNAYFQDLLGRWQSRSNGKSGANTGLILNETILTKLTPFTVHLSINITAHKVTKPINFVYELGLRINGYAVNKIHHNQIFAVNKSVIDPPSVSANKFYAVEYEDYYDLLPTTLPVSGAIAVDLDYISLPQDIVWAYTFDSDDRQVYSPSSITGVNVIYGGVGYTTPTITFSAPASGGVQATGTLTVVGGVITKVVMTNIGQGYAGLTPTFTITGSSTTPANLSSPIVSVQPQWLQSDIIEITKRTLTSFGVSYKDNDFENFGKTTQATGN